MRTPRRARQWLARQAEISLQWSRGANTAERTSVPASTRGERELQWSRGANTAERMRRAEILWLIGLLQWSRGANTAESDDQTASAAQTRGFNGAAVRTPRRELQVSGRDRDRAGASMEPRCEHRGESAQCRSAVTCSLLQWSRGANTAESAHGSS